MLVGRDHGDHHISTSTKIVLKASMDDSQMVTHSKCRAPCVLDVSAPGLEMRHGYRLDKQANRTTLGRSCRLCPQIQNKQWRGNVIAKEHESKAGVHAYQIIQMELGANRIQSTLSYTPLIY